MNLNIFLLGVLVGCLLMAIAVSISKKFRRSSEALSVSKNEKSVESKLCPVCLNAHILKHKNMCDKCWQVYNSLDG